MLKAEKYFEAEEISAMVLGKMREIAVSLTASLIFSFLMTSKIKS